MGKDVSGVFNKSTDCKRVWSYIVIIVISILLLCSITGMKVEASEPPRVAVTVAGLNFRPGPGLQYYVLEVLRRGTNLTVLTTENGWFLVRKNDGSTGWVAGRYTSGPGVRNYLQAVNMARTTAGSLNIRTGPGLNFVNFDQLPRGTRLTVLAEEKGWLLVRLNHGATGWVAGRFTADHVEDIHNNGSESCNDNEAEYSGSEIPDEHVDNHRPLRMVGYYPYWAAYRGHTVDLLDGDRLTHINYAFANIDSSLRITMGDPNIDPANFRALNTLKDDYPHLKTLISVGGWSWSARFSDVALNGHNRSVFAESCVDFITRHGFDGVDLDWEYPVRGGMAHNVSRPADKENFTLLLKELREKLDARGEIDGREYLLTIAGGGFSEYLSNIEPHIIHQYLNYANIMSYDYNGTWSSLTNFNAPLYPVSDSSRRYHNQSVDCGVKAWLSAGFPKDKIVMGVPFYGHKYQGVSNSEQGLAGSFSGGSPVSYADIVNNYLHRPGYVRYYHEQAMVPWLFNGSTFISYEDAESMRRKGEYIRAKGLSGAMIWELSFDHGGVLLESLYESLQ